MSTKPSSDHITMTIDETDLRDFDCGHQGPTATALKVWETSFSLPTAVLSKMCPECRKTWATENIICCAMCGIALPPGVRATTAPPSTKERWKALHHIQDNSAIVCLSRKCCDTAEQAAEGGRWNGSDISPTSLIHKETFHRP